MSISIANKIPSWPEFKKQNPVAGTYVKPRSMSGPPAGEWTASLPVEVVYHVIDQLDPDRNIETIKSPVLTGRELKAYCRPMVFETIDIGRLSCRRKSKESPQVPPPPDIAKFFNNFNVRWMPSPSFTWRYNSQLQEAEALFSYVLDRPLPGLRRWARERPEHVSQVDSTSIFPIADGEGELEVSAKPNLHRLPSLGLLMVDTPVSLGNERLELLNWIAASASTQSSGNLNGLKNLRMIKIFPWVTVPVRRCTTVISGFGMSHSREQGKVA
ncbi:hypothetical protein BKA70DRAFT_1408126 [Coprinopsis sp. MPI-PUGE-AT-0042]|nr:hypothetical protein BKA70DRAFT_1408126 [Coprinopsis sp. MPI-PUGE-AT-0042]